jgi:hypothetical protein
LISLHDGSIISKIYTGKGSDNNNIMISQRRQPSQPVIVRRSKWVILFSRWIVDRSDEFPSERCDWMESDRTPLA